MATPSRRLAANPAAVAGIFEVGSIVSHRYQYGQIEYLIDWKNYPGEDEQTWEPLSHLQNSQLLVDEYNQRNNLSTTMAEKKTPTRSRSVSRSRSTKKSPSKKSPSKSKSKSRSQSRSRAKTPTKPTPAKTPSARKTPAKRTPSKSPSRKTPTRSKTPTRTNTTAKKQEKPKATPIAPTTDITPAGLRSLRSRATTSTENGSLSSSHYALRQSTAQSTARSNARASSRSWNRQWYVWRGHNLLVLFVLALFVIACIFAAFHYRVQMQQQFSRFRSQYLRR